MHVNSKRMKILSLVLGLATISIAIGASALSAGITGRSQTGATCHSATPDPTVSATIVGIPASYIPANMYALTVSVTGGPSNGGGFDLTVTAGTLQTSDLNARVSIAGDEATHTNPSARSWSLTWIAPASGAGTVTFYVAVNAVNLNGGTSGDGWNTNSYTSSEIVADQRPSISLTNPDGNQDWSGGSSQTITWTMNDDNTLPADLIVYLNYSSSASSGAIAGPLPGETSHTWTVPSIDVNDAKVNATVIDSGGLKGYSEALVPKIDSTAPTVVSATPTGTSVALTAPVIVRFSESMDNGGTEGAFSISPDPGGWAFSWSQTSFPEDTLTATHANFALTTTYTVTISTQASDQSKPGNDLSTQYQWSFTTIASGGDVTPPTISSVTAVPSSQTVGSPVNVSALVQDNMAVGSVWLNVTAPGGSSTNSSMSFDSLSGKHYLERSYSVAGVHTFVIWASDSSGNWNSASGQFTMQDSTSPAAPVNLAVERTEARTLKLTWTANSEPDLAGYRVYRSETAGGPYTLLTPGVLVTDTTYIDSDLQGGKTYHYTVTAVDASNNESPKSNEASGETEASQDSSTVLLILAIVIIVVVILMLALLMRRKPRVE